MVDVVQRQYDVPAYATATVAAGAANVSEITITVRNANGKAISTPYCMDLWLSDSAVATGYTATTASGAVTVKTAGTTGTLIGTYLAKFGLRVQTLANGTFVLSITDTAKSLFKVCVQTEGVPYVVATLATASYG